MRITEVKKEGTCSTTFNLVSKCARARTHALPESSCSRARHRRHACPSGSGGRMKTLLIIVCVVFGLYMAGGAAWNYRQGARGLEVVPHLDFWKDLPDLVQVRRPRRGDGPGRGAPSLPRASAVA